MWRLTVLARVCIVMLAIRFPAQPNDVLKSAADAFGTNRIKTLLITGSGATFSVGQNYSPNEPWPRVALKQYTVLINYETGSMRQELLRKMGATMPRGGGVPFAGQLNQIQAISRLFAWNIPVPPDPAAGSLPVGPCTPPEAGGTPPLPAPAPDSQPECMLMLSATPHGFPKAAAANHATETKVKYGTKVSFTIAGKYKMIGLVNPQNGSVANGGAEM